MQIQQISAEVCPECGTRLEGDSLAVWGAA